MRGFLLPIEAAWLLLRAPGLKRYALLPLLASCLLYVVAFGVLIYLLAHWEFSVGEWNFWGPVGGWFSTALNWSLSTLKWLVAIPLALAISYFTFTLLGMVIAAPFNDMLSERVERALCRPNQDLSLPLTLTLKLTLIGIVDAIRILLMQLAAMVLVLPLLLLPIVGFLPLFLVVAYFTGLGFFDVPMGRNYLRWRYRKPAIHLRRSELLGLGVGMEVLFLIPFAGLLLLPLGTTAGTMLYCRSDWTRILSEHGVEPPEEFVPPKVKAAESGMV